jgi:hypothetical protein
VRHPREGMTSLRPKGVFHHVSPLRIAPQIALTLFSVWIERDCSHPFTLALALVRVSARSGEALAISLHT